MGRCLKTAEIDGEHGADESDGAKHSDGREVAHSVQTSLCQSVEGNGVAQCQRRHVEGNAQGVVGEEG